MARAPVRASTASPVTSPDHGERRGLHRLEERRAHVQELLVRRPARTPGPTGPCSRPPSRGSAASWIGRGSQRATRRRSPARRDARRPRRASRGPTVGGGVPAAQQAGAADVEARRCDRPLGWRGEDLHVVAGVVPEGVGQTGPGCLVRTGSRFVEEARPREGEHLVVVGHRSLHRHRRMRHRRVERLGGGRSRERDEGRSGLRRCDLTAEPAAAVVAGEVQEPPTACVVDLRATGEQAVEDPERHHAEQEPLDLPATAVQVLGGERVRWSTCPHEGRPSDTPDDR